MLQKNIERIRLIRWLPGLLSLLGALFYAWQLWLYANMQFSVLDEGLYQYKGWLFASGTYIPFQEYGPWTNQMPLAFLIPGWAQMLFGAGLQTARMFAVVLGILSLVGWWLTARRLSNPWLAAGLVWVMALNPALIRMISMAASQGLIACLLAWTMFFGLGKGRGRIELFTAGLLAGAVVMVRINLIPLLPLLVLYVLWARGWKPALWLLGGEILVFGGMHLFYWPAILKIWAKWLPFGFLRPWFPPKNTPSWNPDSPLAFRLASFFLAFRYHFIALMGGLASWILWPDWKAKDDHQEKFKAAVFLSVLFLAFILLHAWAALGQDYCVFCYPTYTTFYFGIGLLLVVVTLPDWDFRPSAWRLWIGLLAFLGLMAGMAYSAEGAAEQMLGSVFYRRLLSSDAPGFHGAQVWQVFANKYHLEYKAIFDFVHAWFPVFCAVVIGLVVLLLTKWIARRIRINPISIWLAAIVGIGFVFTPLPVVAGDYRAYDCPASVIQGYEQVGSELSRAIPAGSRVYWAGYSPVPLLYLDNVIIYPAQLNGGYSFRISPDDEALFRYGWWNQSLAEKWLLEADYLLVEVRAWNSNEWLRNQLVDQHFERIVMTGAQSCQPDSVMMVYKRK